MNRPTNHSLLKNLRPGPGRYSLPYLAALLFIWNVTYTPLHLASDHDLAQFAGTRDSAVVVGKSVEDPVSADTSTAPVPASKHAALHSAYDHLAAVSAFSSAIVPVLESIFEVSWTPTVHPSEISELQLRLSGARAPPAVTL